MARAEIGNVQGPIGSNCEILWLQRVPVVGLRFGGASLSINLVDYETGETLWGKKGKGIKAQGSVVSYIPTEKGIVITTGFDNAFTNKGEEYYLNVLDVATGTLRYEKSVKLKGDIVSTELTPKGLLFTTTREVNILDINSGTLVWAQSIEAGGPATGDKVRPFPVGVSSGKMYVYSPKESGVFEIDKNSGTHRKLNSVCRRVRRQQADQVRRQGITQGYRCCQRRARHLFRPKHHEARF